MMMTSLSLFCTSPSLHSNSRIHKNPTPISLFHNNYKIPIRLNKRLSRVSSSPNDAANNSSIPPADTNASNFCIIEGPETVQDFMKMQLQEIEDNIRSRRNKIFLLMEEVRRLRVQQRIKGMKVVDESHADDDEMPEITSSIPFLPHVTPNTLKQLHLTSFSFISGIIVFGGLVAPISSGSYCSLLFGRSCGGYFSFDAAGS